ncbi:glucokinase [Methylorubrum aminovorans]
MPLPCPVLLADIGGTYARLAVAGRVASGVTPRTNAPWRLDLGGIGVAQGLEPVRLANDYASRAAILGILEEGDPADLVRIGPRRRGPNPGGRPPPDPEHRGRACRLRLLRAGRRSPVARTDAGRWHACV